MRSRPRQIPKTNECERRTFTPWVETPTFQICRAMPFFTLAHNRAMHFIFKFESSCSKLSAVSWLLQRVMMMQAVHLHYVCWCYHLHLIKQQQELWERRIKLFVFDVQYTSRRFLRLTEFAILMKKVNTNTLEYTANVCILCVYTRNTPCYTRFYNQVPFTLHVISLVQNPYLDMVYQQ